MSAALAEQTYTPDRAGDLAPVLSFLEAHQQAHGTTVTAQCALVGAGEHDRVDVPEDLHRVLVQVVEALRAGKAVTVTPRDLTMTTQQVADYLGVSRPTVVKLIDDGQLPAERIGSRRRVKLADVDAYRARRREEQYAALFSTAVELDANDDPQVARERLAAIRTARGARRRAHRTD